MLKFPSVRQCRETAERVVPHSFAEKHFCLSGGNLLSHDMAMPLIVGQEWRRRISRMQWLLNAVLAVECLSMPFLPPVR